MLIFGLLGACVDVLPLQKSLVPRLQFPHTQDLLQACDEYNPSALAESVACPAMLLKLHEGWRRW